MGTDCIILHRLEEPLGFNTVGLQVLTASSLSFALSVYFGAGANVDALFRGTGNLPPSTIILDYMYGVAAYNMWGMQQLDGVVEQYYKLHYEPMLQHLPRKPQRDDDHGDWADNTDSDPDYNSGTSQDEYTSTGDSRMAKAMDNMNRAIMYLKGISPKDAANLREK